MITIKDGVLEQKEFVLGPINIQLKSNEFISVVGPSGSGKSTFIKTITRNNKLTSGTILYSNCSSDDIMYISQSGTTFNHLYVRDNLTLKYNYAKEQMTDCLALVGLSLEYLNKYPFELSGGERQRVDLVRALLSESKYIILDESMSALDSKNKKSISRLLKDFVDTKGISIIYITHDVMQAMEYSTRIIEINNGQIVFDGNTDDYGFRLVGE